MCFKATEVIRVLGFIALSKLLKLSVKKAHVKINKMNTDYKNKENATDLRLHGDACVK